MADSRRAARVSDRVREEMMKTLKRDIADPRLASIIVTRVFVPDDLQVATVYVRLEIGGDDEKARKAALAGLKSAAGRIRRTVGGGLGLRYTPDFRFAYDDGVDATTRVEEILHEIKKDGREDD